MEPPKLTFIYAYPLDMQMKQLLLEKGIETYPSSEEIKETITHWNELWQEQDEKLSIIKRISEITKRIPKRSLECFVFGTGLKGASTPFLIPVKNVKGETLSDEKFVDMVIHELLHIFLITDNKKYWEAMFEKYAKESPACRNHVVLYAMLHELYREVFDKEPGDFLRENLPAGYARAIQIVKERGSENLIREYHSFI